MTCNQDITRSTASCCSSHNDSDMLSTHAYAFVNEQYNLVPAGNVGLTMHCSLSENIHLCAR